MGSSNRDTQRIDQQGSFVSFVDKLPTTWIGRKIYERLGLKDTELSDTLSLQLEQALIGVPAEIYIIRSISVSVIAGALATIPSFILSAIIVNFVSLPISVSVGVGSGVFSSLAPVVRLIMIGLLATIVTTVVAASVFFSLLVFPRFRVSKREREINYLLFDSIAYMYALSQGGIDRIGLFERMAQAESTYGEVSREFIPIVRKAKYLNTDYKQAVREQASKTPSLELEEFLTDFLSVLDSGGEISSFLEDKYNDQQESTEREQERMLDTLSLFGEIYVTLSVFPLLLLVILVVVGFIGGGSQTTLLIGVVYGLIPILNVAFVVIISAVSFDQFGEGYIPTKHVSDTMTDSSGQHIKSMVETCETPSKTNRKYTDMYETPNQVPVRHSAVNTATKSFSMYTKLVNSHLGQVPVKKAIKRSEYVKRSKTILTQPHVFLRENISYTLLVTIPVTLLWLGVGVLATPASLSISGFTENTMVQTVVFVYVPIYITAVPVALLNRWRRKRKQSIVSSFSETLNELARSNDTGITLLESIRISAETSSGLLSKELNEIYTKVQYGVPLQVAITDFNNKFESSQISRVLKILIEGQSVSNRLSSVLLAASDVAKMNERLNEQRSQTTRTQSVTVFLTFIIMLIVLGILQIQFIGEFGDLDGIDTQGAISIGSVDPELLSTLFFHAATLQGIMAGLVAAYISSGQIVTAAKYITATTTVTLAIWTIIISI